MPYTPASNQISNLPQAQAIHYVKTFIENLKAETPYLRQCTRMELPENSGNTVRLFMYTPLGANTTQSAEGTVGSGLTVNVQTVNALMGEYSDYANFSSFAVATAIDPLVDNVQKEMAYRLGQSLSLLVRTLVDTSAAAIDPSVAIALAATSTSSYTTNTNTQLRSAVMSLQGRSVKPLDGRGMLGGVIHPFVLGDILADTSNNSPIDILKHTPEGFQKLEDLGSTDQAELVQFPSTDVIFAKTPLVNLTSNYKSVSGLTGIRTYIFGRDAVIGIRLGAKGDTAFGDGNYQNIQCNVVRNAPSSAADPAGLIPAWTAYRVHFTVSFPPDTTMRLRYIDGASGIS